MPVNDQELLATLRAVDVASEPVDPASWPLLADPDARREIDRRLRAVGRQLVALRDPADANRVVIGYVTSWDDGTAETLLAEHNPLSTTERAVLALILLHSMAIPQSSGTVPSRGFRSSTVFDRSLLTDRHGPGDHVLGKTAADEAVKTLIARDLVTSDLRPGPAFDRLSPAATDRIWRGLLILARPSWARHLRAETTSTNPYIGTEPA